MNSEEFEQQPAQEKPKDANPPPAQADMLRCLQSLEASVESIARSIRQEFQELHRLRSELPNTFVKEKHTLSYELKIGKPSSKFGTIVIRGPLVVHPGCIEFVRDSTGKTTYFPIADLQQWEIYK